MERHGRTANLSKVFRFHSSWEAEASLKLRAGSATTIPTYTNHGRIHAGQVSHEATVTLRDGNLTGVGDPEEQPYPGRRGRGLHLQRHPPDRHRDPPEHSDGDPARHQGPDHPAGHLAETKRATRLCRHRAPGPWSDRGYLARPGRPAARPERRSTWPWPEAGPPTMRPSSSTSQIPTRPTPLG